MADLGVLGGGLGDPAGDAGGLGAEQDRRQAGHRAPVEPGQQPVRGHDGLVGTDPGHRPGEVQALQRRDVEAGGIDRGPYLAVFGLHREDDEVGQDTAEYRAGLALDDQAAAGGAGHGAGGLPVPAAAEPVRPAARPTAAVLDPSARPVTSLPVTPAAARAALAQTVGRNAPGTSARPSSSTATASSGRP